MTELETNPNIEIEDFADELADEALDRAPMASGSGSYYFCKTS
jgi:hypothetical protein